jgi:hypothetical protein
LLGEGCRGNDCGSSHLPAFGKSITGDRGKAHIDSIRLPAGGREIGRLVSRFTEALAQGDLTYRSGEGIVGFTWALFVAGCPSSVVSQWKVDSASTKRLMVAFHRALLGAHDTKLAKAKALRTAKLALLRDPRWRHPFYWSAFVLVGSARLGP